MMLVKCYMIPLTLFKIGSPMKLNIFNFFYGEGVKVKYTAPLFSKQFITTRPNKTKPNFIITTNQSSN